MTNSTWKWTLFFNLHLLLLLKSHVFFCLRVRQMLCVQYLYCWSLFPQELVNSLVILSFINGFFLPVNPPVYLIWLFWSLLLCCLVSCVYRSCTLPLRHLHFRNRISCSFWYIISKVGLKWGKYNCQGFSTAPTWLQVLCGNDTKLFSLPKGLFIIFESSLARGIRRYYRKRGDEVLCSNFLWLISFSCNRKISLQR